MSWPLRRILSRVAIHLGEPSPTRSSGLPVNSGGPPSNVHAEIPVLTCLNGETPLDLAPGGVYQAATVTGSAGGLLHHRFTLTIYDIEVAVCFLWHFPASHLGLPLTTTLPCGVRTFLDLVTVAAT